MSDPTDIENVAVIQRKLLDLLNEPKEFSNNDKVLGYSNAHLYRAVILDIRNHPTRQDAKEYYIHYTRFANIYDEWVNEKKLVAVNDETLKIRSILRSIYMKYKNNKKN